MLFPHHHYHTATYYTTAHSKEGACLKCVLNKAISHCAVHQHGCRSSKSTHSCGAGIVLLELVTMLMQSAEFFNSIYTQLPQLKSNSFLWCPDGYRMVVGPREKLSNHHTPPLWQPHPSESKQTGEFVCCGTTKYLVRVLSHKQSECLTNH